MSSTFFTTDDGDIILRAGSGSDSKHAFRVHKFVLALASPVFKDMLAFPQPPDQTLNGPQQIPAADVPEPPKVVDSILRFIYPGVEPPKITELPTLTALLSAADKYNITSMHPTLREKLKTFLPGRRSLWVYAIACRFGFSDVAKEAARVSRTQDLRYLDEQGREDLRHISSASLFQLVQFVHTREQDGLSTIRENLSQLTLWDSTKCLHDGHDTQDYYFYLQKAVEEAFIDDPHVGSKDLFALLDKVPDPPRGCSPPRRSAEWYYDGGDDEPFGCPLLPMGIRKRLSDITYELQRQNTATLEKFFGKGFGGV